MQAALTPEPPGPRLWSCRPYPGQEETFSSGRCLNQNFQANDLPAKTPASLGERESHPLLVAPPLLSRGGAKLICKTDTGLGGMLWCFLKRMKPVANLSRNFSQRQDELHRPHHYRSSDLRSELCGSLSCS